MSYQHLLRSLPPGTPVAGKGRMYDSTSGERHFLNDAGIDANLIQNQKYNWLRNSGFWFAQRQSTTTVTPVTYSGALGSRLISADGWGITNSANASVQYATLDTDNGSVGGQPGIISRFYGQLTKITVAGAFALSQVVEGTDTDALRGQTVRVQVWLKGVTTIGAVWRIGLVQLTSAGAVDVVPSGGGLFITAFPPFPGTDPTLGANLSYIAPKVGVAPDGGTIIGNALSVQLASTVTWQRAGAVFDVPTTAKNLIVMIWSTVNVALADGIAISQVSLTVGQEIQDWSALPLQQELARVQRFYCKSFDAAIGPAQGAFGGGPVRGAVSVAGATAGQPIGLRFPVAMRAAPTITFFNRESANAFVRNTTAATDATATAAANVGENGADITFTGLAAWTVCQSVYVNYTADAEL